MIDVPGTALVDHHCHGIVPGVLDRARFESLLSEGGAPPPGTSNFDTPAGLAVRRHCAPLLDLDPHAAPDEYLERRAALGDGAVSRLLGAAGIGRHLVDTGFRGDELTTPDELAAYTGAGHREIVRLEAVAEALAAEGVEPDAFAPTFARRLEEVVREGGAAGLKSVAAYRVGFDFDPSPPSSAEVTGAAANWLHGLGEEPPRLADPTLTRLLLWTAVETGLPIQFHVGLGDSDIRLHRTDPALLTDFVLAAPRTPVMLLHCYPFHRNAGYLAAVHPTVHLDLGLTLTFVGPARAGQVLAEALELAPFGKVLFSSDAFGLAEFYHLGAYAFRRALGDVTDERVRSGEWAAADAERIVTMIAAGNAERVYGL
ncbi:amidohydrolase family protein [Pseudonocardia endophytica]|uniref:Amidohydrolase-related domain-containing protein n=1 Tax=Pseudonocardia endophytica TaxID=401976 RepID=A0A4R1HGF7_PSEEN|nr:amidohydrolase family protein [Pseudonocardia endophytica]TCK19941.1 hypothetical protein EV378_3885 [Pseudonocardia endophytica]